MERFKALLASKGPEGQSIAWQELGQSDLMEGDVLVRVSHSTVNYKDGLAITGKAPVIRRWPMIPGIDFAGQVVSSGHADFKPGDGVILNGWGVGETYFGGYAQMARVKGDWLVPLPRQFSPAESMAVGTAARRMSSWTCPRCAAELLEPEPQTRIDTVPLASISR